MMTEKTKEYILSAACWYADLGSKEEDVIHACNPRNITEGVVFCGHRHAQCIYTMYSVTGLKQHQAGKEVQGFLTNKNRFVDRVEAAQIAFDTKQTEELKTRLFSEDLY